MEVGKKFFSIEKCAVGQRIDVFLQSQLREVTRSFVRNLIDKGQVLVGGEIKKSGYSLKFGDEILVEILAPKQIDLTPSDEKLDIIYEDDDLAVVNKRQGMVVHPAAGSYDNTLVNALLSNLNALSGINGEIRPGIVHRLDKNTSGLLVVAKNDAAHLSLQRQIAKKDAKRYYLAIVNGNLKEDSGVICEPIGRSRKNRKLMAVEFDGREAITNYKVVERFGLYTLVEYELKTGRTHQIRVHSKYIGHIIVGDKEYGDKNKFKQEGQLLHAYKLTFTHPKSGKEMTFEAPLPEHFRAVLTILREINNK